MMKKILRLLALVFMTGAQLVAVGKPQHPGAKPPAPIILLNAGEHLLCGKSRDGKIELEDGTQFKALAAEALKVYEDWDYHDHLVITPNTMPMGGSEFYLTNLDKEGQFVHVNFLSEPHRGNSYSQFVFHIDPFDGEIYIHNNDGTETVWTIDPKDLHHLDQWEHGHHVLTGKNDLWIGRLRSSYEFVLVNIDRSYLPPLHVTPCLQ